MRAIEPFIYSRNGHLYYRTALPRHLHSLLPVKEIVLSLNSQDLSDARLSVAKLNYAKDKALKEFHEQLNEAKDHKDLETALVITVERLDQLKCLVVNNNNLNDKLSILKKRASDNLLFSNIVQRYLNDCMSDSYSTQFQKQATFTMFEELIGDIVFNRINIETARHFKSCLLKIPANAKKRYNITSFKDIDLDKLEGQPQHPKTINNRLAYMIALFNWARRNDYYKDSNPFSNLSIRSHKGISAKRDTFKQDELQALFSSPIYMGSIGSEWRKRLQTGDKIIKDSLYWVPLIGLYSGLRMNEICQLHVSDITTIDAIPVFDINDDSNDKALKTASSRRIVPIHKAILGRDFMAYIKAQSGTRAFPDISLGSDKSYSSVFSKRFRRLLQALELKRDGLCFHSLRHTFIDGMRNAGVERSITMAITGHQSKDVHDNYGHGYNLSVLQGAINRYFFSYLSLGFNYTLKVVFYNTLV